MRSTASYLALALVALSAILTGANWYVNPERGRAWAITLGLIALLLVLIWIARRLGSLRLGADWIWNGVIFAALMLIVGLGGKFAQTLGAIDDQDLSRRLTMALIGAFLAMIGNAMPKMLTPLSAMACDSARTQAFQRFSGWTWFMAGVTYAVVWLVLPIDLAKSVGVMVIMASMFVVAGRLFQLWRTSRGGQARV
jgi:hypothetical protein